VELLLQPTSDLRTVDSSVRWILAMGTRSQGSPRYAFFTTVQAQKAVMRTVSRNKQNNLRVSDFEGELMTWDELMECIRQFLVE
jgi:hypothetical protein